MQISENEAGNARGKATRRFRGLIQKGEFIVMVDQPIKALQDHAVYEVANALASYLGFQKDWICLAEFLSLAAGRMAIPINLDVVSDQCAVERMIADRVCHIVPGKCIPIDSHRSLLAAERTGFDDKYVLLCRRDYPKLHEDTVGVMAKAPDTVHGAPSVWRIHEKTTTASINAPTLRLIAVSADRQLDRVARSFSSIEGKQEHRMRLNELVETLCPRLNYPCSFRDEFSGSVSVTNMVTLERLLQCRFRSGSEPLFRFELSRAVGCRLIFRK
jgi:hypothetical protein